MRRAIVTLSLIAILAGVGCSVQDIQAAPEVVDQVRTELGVEDLAAADKARLLAAVQKSYPQDRVINAVWDSGILIVRLAPMGEAMGNEAANAVAGALVSTSPDFIGRGVTGAILLLTGIAQVFARRRSYTPAPGGIPTMTIPTGTITTSGGT